MYSINDLAVPKSPFLDTMTNRPTREWLMYLLSLGRQPVYGAFTSTSTQAGIVNTPQRLAFDTQDVANQMYYTTGDGIHVQQDGIYNVQFSVQLVNTDTAIHDVTLWFRLNGVDVANSASTATMPTKHGSVNGAIIVAANLFITMMAGDYIEMWWATDTTQVSVQTLPAQTSPYAAPLSPGLIITLQKVDL